MRKALLAVAAVLASAGSAAARFGMPEPLTDRGRVVEEIYAQIAVAGILVFILVFALLVFVLVRYREGSGKGRSTHEKHRGSLGAELTWTLVPLAIVLWVGYIAYAGLVTLDRGEEDMEPEMTLRITGVQWAWQMDYGSGVTVNVVAQPDARGNLTYSDVFRVPADTPIRLNLTGGDVIHAFNVVDANRVYFLMEDANPLGPHKYFEQVVSFPAGEYLIQCKEMCLNPGHGYMRAQLVAEPREAFDRWFEERRLGAGSDLLSKVEVTATAAGLATEQDTTVVTGTRVIVDLENRGSDTLQLTLPNGTSLSVPAGERSLFAFDAEQPGNLTLASSAGSLAFTVIDAEVVDIDLFSYGIRPETVQLQAGQTYLLRLRSLDSVHNYYIGHWNGGGEGKEILAASPNVGGGNTGAFVYTPTESGSFDAWCDVPGHAQAGMVARTTIQ